MVTLSLTTSTLRVLENACGGGYSTCYHEGKCSPGDIADIKGQLTATTAFSNAQVYVKPCFKMYCSKSDSRIDGRICDWIKPVSSDTTCGAPGDYIFDERVQLPAGATMYQWVLDTLTIKIHVDEEIECETNSVNSYRLPYNLMGLGVLAGIAIAVWRDDKMKRRLRNIMKRRLRNEEEKAKKEYNDEETQNDEESYVEMGRMGSNFSDETVSTTSYSPPGSVVSVENSPQNSSEPDNKIPLEVLREFYKKKGIAIVWEKKEYNDEETQNDEESYVEMGRMGSNFSDETLSTTSYSLENISQNSSEPDNKIQLEVLREFYKKKGIAIV